MDFGPRRIRSNEWMKPVFGWPVMLVLLGAAWWAAIRFGLDDPANWPAQLEQWQRDYARDPVPFYIAGVSAVAFLFILVKLIIDTVSLARFGVISLEPDPYPGSVGGHIGGVIRLGYLPGANDHVTVTVVCWRHYVKRSGGKSQSATDRHWSMDIHPEIGQDFKQAAVRFTSDIPRELPATGEQGGDRYRWQVLLRVERPGRDIVRIFTVPVEKTDMPKTAAREMRRDSQAGIPLAGMEIEESAGRLAVAGRLGRNLGFNVMVMIFGGLFTGAGLFLGIGVAWDHAQQLLAGDAHWASLVFSSLFVLIPGFMALVFFLIGLVILLAGLTSLVNRRRMQLDEAMLTTSNWLRQDSMPRGEIESFELAETGSVGTQTQHDLFALSHEGDSVKVLEGIPGQLAAREIASKVQEFTGLPVKDVGKRSRLRKRLERMAKQGRE